MLPGLEEHEVSMVAFGVVFGLIVIVCLITVFICCKKSEESTPLLQNANHSIQASLNDGPISTSTDGERNPLLLNAEHGIQEPGVNFDNDVCTSELGLPKIPTPSLEPNKPPDKPPDIRYSPCGPKMSPTASPVYEETPEVRDSSSLPPTQSPTFEVPESPKPEIMDDQDPPGSYSEVDPDLHLSESYKVRVKDRQKSAQEEEEKMVYLAEILFKNHVEKFSSLLDLGSRLQKKWFLRGRGESMDMLQIVVKSTNQLSKSLTSESLTSLNMLLRKLEHPYLLRIYGVDMQDDLFSVLIKFNNEGSLRDILHSANPMEDWSAKYTPDGGRAKLLTSEIATCGRHILEALIALYEAGFPAIGQIHTGNVFRMNGRFVLGGYENILLGYRTSRYQDLAGNVDWLNKIDVILFGHLIYEIATGKPLECAVPDKNYKYEEITKKEIKQVLQFIFKVKWKGSNLKTIEQIRSHQFFCNKLIDVTVQSLKSVAADTQETLNQLTLAMGGSTLSLDQPDLSDLNDKLLKKTLSKKFKNLRMLERIGGNYWKLWATASHSKFTDGLLCIAAVPSYCPIYVKNSVDAMKSLCSRISSNCRFTHEIKDIQCAKVKDKWVVTFFQPIMQCSLKDIIYNCQDPLQSWNSRCHSPMPQGLDISKIARYAYQILEAMIFLKEIDRSLLLYIHTGNVYIKGDNCVVGGFENAFLKYRSQNLRIGYEYEDNIEVLIFGHVIYEMITGKLLAVAVPHEEDYAILHESTRTIVRFIFEHKEDNSELVHSLNDVIKHSFFSDYNKMYELRNISLTKQEVQLFQEIRKSKARNQDDKFRAIKKRTQSMWGQ